MGGQALRVDDFDGMRWLADLQSACARNGANRHTALARDLANDFLTDETDTLQSFAPSDVPTSEEIDMDFRSSDAREIQNASARNLQSKDDRKPLADTMGQDELAIATRNALRDAFGDSSAAVKRIAAAANCNMRAARNWFEGENPPSLLYALRLMANVPEFQAMVRKLAAMEGDLDPNFERAMSEAISLFQQAAGRGK